ncbi:uncharacterized protein [Procambarus clarkii]|uniref:uncharacterized protein n=1 Tax=Procambarus clarkii TaxID=6728 RepID=UPI0037434DB5
MRQQEIEANKDVELRRAELEIAPPAPPQQEDRRIRVRVKEADIKDLRAAADRADMLEEALRPRREGQHRPPVYSGNSRNYRRTGASSPKSHLSSWDNRGSKGAVESIKKYQAESSGAVAATKESTNGARKTHGATASGGSAKLELAKIEREQQKEALQQQKEVLQMREREAVIRKVEQEGEAALRKEEAAIKKEQQEREAVLAKEALLIKERKAAIKKEEQEQPVNLMIVEEFLRRVPPSVRLYLADKEETDYIRCAKSADTYNLIHRHTPEPPSSKKSWYSNDKMRLPIVGVHDDVIDVNCAAWGTP